MSINGVADLPKMISKETRDHGSKHWVVNYWKHIIENSNAELESLHEISPSNFADKYRAPVLLVHGKDDTVVSIKQSYVMEKSLQKANKSVKLVALEGEDHWLSTSASRLAMLKEVDRFLDLHNPVD